MVVQDPSKTFLTTTNVNQGTAMYMAPEQFNGTRLDEKYGLDLLLYWM